MASTQNDFTIEIVFAGETKQVEITPYDFGTGKQCKCRMTWDDEPIAFWLHFKAGVWKFKNPGQVPKDLLSDAGLFNRALKLKYNQ